MVTGPPFTGVIVLSPRSPFSQERLPQALILVSTLVELLLPGICHFLGEFCFFFSAAIWFSRALMRSASSSIHSSVMSVSSGRYYYSALTFREPWLWVYTLAQDPSEELAGHFSDAIEGGGTTASASGSRPTSFFFAYPGAASRRSISWLPHVARRTRSSWALGLFLISLMAHWRY